MMKFVSGTDDILQYFMKGILAFTQTCERVDQHHSALSISLLDRVQPAIAAFLQCWQIFPMLLGLYCRPRPQPREVGHDAYRNEIRWYLVVA